MKQRCRICGRMLGLEHFHKKASHKTGYQSWCKNCRSEYQRKWYSANAEKHRVNTAVRRKRVQKEQQLKIRALAVTSGCVDCGNKDWRVLEWDHVRGEPRSRVTSLTGNKWSVIQEEIDKCEVRCANCHKIRHSSSSRTPGF